MTFFIIVYLLVGCCVTYGWLKALEYDGIIDAILTILFWPTLMLTEAKNYVYCGYTSNPSVAVAEYIGHKYINL